MGRTWKNAQEYWVIGKIKRTIFPDCDCIQYYDTRRGKRHRATRQHASGDAKLGAPSDPEQLFQLIPSTRTD